LAQKLSDPGARVQVEERLKLHIGLLNPEIQKASETSNSNKPASSISSNYTFYSEVNKDIETFGSAAEPSVFRTRLRGFFSYYSYIQFNQNIGIILPKDKWLKLNFYT
jgi:hypothetical protein